MNHVDLLAIVLAGVLEGKTRNARGGLLGNNLQALDHPGDNFVLESRVQAIRILPNDDEVYVRIARGDVGQIANRTEVGVELELLPQGDVDAGKAAANRSAHR